MSIKLLIEILWIIVGVIILFNTNVSSNLFNITLIFIGIDVIFLIYYLTNG